MPSTDQAIDKQKRTLEYSFWQICLLTLLIIALKTVQVYTFHEEDTGLLSNEFASRVVGIVSWAAAAYIAVRAWLLALAADKAKYHFRIALTPPVGFSMLLAGIFFLAQSILDLTGFLKQLQEHPEIPYYESALGPIAPLVCLISFISAICFFMMGYSVAVHRRKPSAWLCILPIVWNVLCTVQMLYTYPLVVSIQSNASKTVTSVLSMLLLYVLLMQICGGDKRLFILFGGAALPGLILSESLPYALLGLLGIRDESSNMPTLSMIGLALCGFVLLFQVVRSAMIGLNRQRRAGRNSANPEELEEELSGE